jgi:Ser-tRNA(Ala) deacylase AlaX
LEGPLNDVIRADLPVGASFMPYDEAPGSPGLFRSKAVAPPPGNDGLVRIVEISGLDRQACGGTHLASTGQARPARIVKMITKAARTAGSKSRSEHDTASSHARETRHPISNKASMERASQT